MTRDVKRDRMELSRLPVMLLLISLIQVSHVRVSPKPVVSIQPNTHVYGGEDVILRCDIQGGGDTEWTYSWYRTSDRLGPRAPYGDFTYSTRKEFDIWYVIASDSGDYTCRGRSRDSQISEISDAVTLTVSEIPQVVLSVSAQSWLTEGDSVTLRCEVTDSSTGWTFRWYTVPHRKIKDSHGDYVSGRSYTISSAARNHTGVYWCRAERDRSHLTLSSNLQPLWITGESPPVSLIINPSRTQHFTNDSLSLSCEDQNHSTGWTVKRYTQSEGVLDCSWWGSVTGSTCNISSLSSFYTGVYWCESESGGNSNPVNITVHGLIALTPVPHSQGSTKAVVSIEPNTHVYRGERVGLRCNIQDGGDTEWTYSWYKNSLDPHIGSGVYISIKYVTDSDSGDYSCKGRSKDSQISEISDAVTLTVSAKRPQVELSVSPQSWLTEGDSVTLNCEVTDSSTGWRFSWYTVNPNREIRDSHGEIVSGRSYTIRSAPRNHTGVYWCRAERNNSPLTLSSNLQPLWITGESPPVSLIINPSRTQHFTNDSLSLICEDQSNPTGWTVRRYTHSEGVLDCSWWGSVTGSTCNISSLSTSHTGVYWCESESGETSNPVNITVYAPFSVLMLISSVASPYLLVTIILLIKCYRARAHTDADRTIYAVIGE